MDYKLDYSEALGLDIIVESVWVNTSNATFFDPSHTDTTTTIWVKDAVKDTMAKAVNRVTTQGGRIIEQAIFWEVKEL